jgi:CheY-like chemotaxis protein
MTRRTKGSCSEASCSSTLASYRRVEGLVWECTVSLNIPVFYAHVDLCSFCFFAVSYGIMSQLGGSLSVYSEGEGHGTTFTLRHPACKDSRLEQSVLGDQQSFRMDRSYRASCLESESRASSISIGEEANNVASGSPKTALPLVDGQVIELSNEGGLCILVVDHAASNRKMLRRMLEDPLKYRCDEGVDGRNAVELIKQSIWIPELGPVSANSDASGPFSSDEMCRRTYDAVLMEHTMPNMSGPETAKAMRELGYKGLILGITGHADVSAQNAFIASGADRVFTRPVERTELIALLEGFRTYN